ncbi:MAG: CopG family transcriptional regulator [Microcoleus sp. SIO2G3]|nr:CopG family transcriptional regulator [Microcoleus sp. SIO2G3]
MGGKTSLAGVTTYIPPEWKKELEEWAQEEERSVSWILLKLIGNALEERRQNSSSATSVESTELVGLATNGKTAAR